jgi:hypothetical protein
MVYNHRVLTPDPLPIGTAKAGKNTFNRDRPNHISYMTSSALYSADVSSPYKLNAELTQWAFYISIITLSVQLGDTNRE